MTKKLFIIGASASGKLTAARTIIELAQQYDISTSLFNSTDVLENLYRTSQQHDSGKFRPIIQDGQEIGYEVIDFSVYDDEIVLKSQLIQEQVKEDRKDLIIILDSPRNPDQLTLYCATYPDIFANAFFLCIDAPLSQRKVRVNNRNSISSSRNLGYHTATIFDRFGKIPLSYITHEFKDTFRIPDNHIHVITNIGTMDAFLKKISTYTHSTLFPLLM